MLPFELRHGERLDINRAFGNGEDNTNPPDGVVDDPLELSNPEHVFDDVFDRNVRQIFARYDNDSPGASFAEGRQILAQTPLLLDDGPYGS